MSLRRPTFAGVVAVVLAALAGCAPTGPSGNGEPGPAPQVSCDPIAGDDLVVLKDDKSLQTADNVVPAINAEAAEPEMVEALDAVSRSLDTPTLIDLNRQVDIERNTSSQVASSYLAEADLNLPTVPDGGRVVVGAANFSESGTLAQIYAGALREVGYDTSVRTIGNRETYLPALIEGRELDVVPEYVGTLTEFLNKRANGADADPIASSDVDATMQALRTLGEEVGLVFGEPSEAADQNAFAVTAAFAKKHDVETLSQLAEACGGVVLGGPPECPERTFCQPGLEETYGLDIVEFVSLDAGGPLTKAALQRGRIALGLVFSSDAALATEA